VTDFPFSTTMFGWDITNVLNITAWTRYFHWYYNISRNESLQLVILVSSEFVSSELRPDNNKPIIDTDIPKIIVRVIIFLINLFHSHQRGITQLPNLLNI